LKAAVDEADVAEQEKKAKLKTTGKDIADKLTAAVALLQPSGFATAIEGVKSDNQIARLKARENGLQMFRHYIQQLLNHPLLVASADRTNPFHVITRESAGVRAALKNVQLALLEMK
jgi:hypothetical protein